MAKTEKEEVINDLPLITTLEELDAAQAANEELSNGEGDDKNGQ